MKFNGKLNTNKSFTGLSHFFFLLSKSLKVASPKAGAVGLSTSPLCYTQHVVFMLFLVASAPTQLLHFQAFTRTFQTGRRIKNIIFVRFPPTPYKKGSPHQGLLPASCCLELCDMPESILGFSLYRTGRQRKEAVKCTEWYHEATNGKTFKMNTFQPS